MSPSIIHAENLGKRYRIGERMRDTGLRHVLDRAISAPARLFRPRKPSLSNGDATHFWALKDVSFDVKAGEVVGIIGRNGAGKSTLLKILARVTKPTRGFVDVHGRMGSLLEVGTGFHPELTGRENTFLSGAILGMSKSEITRKFDEIVAFAEVEKFIDTPIKHYSSGMQLRLAFAVAAHLEPEILLVDEVLAVGDVNFQKKCLGKMGEVAKAGRTILFVSHSMAAVSSLCQKGILLENGQITCVGSVGAVVDRYLFRPEELLESIDLRNYRREGGTGEVRITSANLLDRTGNPSRNFEYGDDLRFEVTLEKVRSSPPLHFAIAIHTTLSVPVLHLFSSDDPKWSALDVDSKIKVSCVLERADLYPGTYSVSIWAGVNGFQCTDCVADVLRFHMDQGQLRSRGFEVTWAHGLVHRNSAWSILDPLASRRDLSCVSSPE